MLLQTDRAGRVYGVAGNPRAVKHGDGDDGDDAYCEVLMTMINTMMRYVYASSCT